MTWDPSSHSSRVNVDVNTTIKNSVSNPGGMSRKFQSSSGTTTDFEFMQTAQLVFPGLDYIAAAPGEEAKGIKNKLKRSKNFVTEYMDRRAQAEFVSVALFSIPLFLFFNKNPSRSVKTRIICSPTNSAQLLHQNMQIQTTQFIVARWSPSYP